MIGGRGVGLEETVPGEPAVSLIGYNLFEEILDIPEDS